MDATQQIEDSFFGEEEDVSEDEHELGGGKSQREPLALLRVFRNDHIPETEVPLYQGENVLGRDPTSSSVPLQARSISGRHAIISISVFGPNDRHGETIDALLWDLGSLNGTRKGLLKLTPHVRYALTEGDSVVLADVPCQYVSLKKTERSTLTSTADGGKENAKGPTSTSSRGSEGGTGKVVEKKSALPPVPVWTDEVKSLQSRQTTDKKPERTLVPESDSDSDGETHGRRERRRIVASVPASSDLSSPTCSTFLTPANKVIPESEDESSSTSSPALKGHFLKTGNDPEVSSDSSKPEPLSFNIDSDTDVEDEDVEMEKMKATPGSEAAVPAEVAAVNPADLHMDSDTDVEEEETEKAKSDPEASAPPPKQDLVNPAPLTMDSDTVVEENEPVKMDPTVMSGPEAAQEEKKEPVSSAQFHLESDTDVEDEDVPQIHDPRSPPSRVAEFNVNSDTDVEEDEETTKSIEPPSGSEMDSKDLVMKAKSADSVREPDTTVSDSDTDLDDEVTDITSTVAKGTGKSQTHSEIQTADGHGADAQHDSPFEIQPPAEAVRDEFKLDSDTDVEEGEDKVEEKEQKCAEAAIKIVHSSTPRGAGLSEEELETQAFLSPSQLFKRPVLPSLLHPSVSPGGISHTDDDFAVAETQSFVCDAARADATLDETPELLDGPESRRSDRASSFQLGLSDNGDQLPEPEEHEREPAEEDWQLQATQLYAMKNSGDDAKSGQTQLDLDATQAYADVMGQEEGEDGGKEEEEEETQPLAAQSRSSIHTAETQLIKHRARSEDNSDHGTNEEVVASEPERKAEEDVNDEMQVDLHLSTADTLLIIRSPRQEEPSQPYAFLAAQIQKEQEETEKVEHESRDQEVQETDEGERAQNEMDESVGQEKADDEGEGREIKENENMLIKKKDEVTRDGPEEVEKKRVEADKEVDEVQTPPAETDAIVETLPVCEEEEGCEEEQLNEPNSSRGTPPAKIESTQPLEPDDHPHITIAETLPVCEEEEGREEEQLNEPNSSRGTPPAKIESTQSLEPDDHPHVTIAETLPVCEEEEGHEEEQNKPRNSRRRQTTKVEPKQPVESDQVAHVTIAETQPMCEEEREEEQQSEAIPTKRSSMRKRNAKPVESHVAVPETLPMCEEEEGQEEKPQSEAKSGRKSRRGRPTTRIESTQPLEPESTAETVKMEKEDEEQGSRRSLRGKERGRAASGKGKGKGKAAAEKDKTGKSVKVEQEEDSEEEVDRWNRGRGRRQKSKDDDKARFKQVEPENEEGEHLKKHEKESKRLQKEEAARDRLETERKGREKRTRLEKDREEREEHEKGEQEEKDRLERERMEEEMKRFEREKEMEKEKQEKDREGVEKQKRPAPGNRKTGSGRKGKKSKKDEEQELEEGTNGRLETEQEPSELQKQDCAEGSSRKEADEQAESEAKRRGGRRSTRKSIVPPVGVEDEGGPAKRTRSRSNSSNSVCSEQSTQDSLSGGRRRGGRRQTAKEMNETVRPSGRRTTTAPSSEKGDNIKQAAPPRSNSRSSDRSSSSVATPSRGRGGKGRKSVKAEEPEEEKGEQSAVVGRGRGRGRGGKRPGANDVKVETAGEAEEEEAVVMTVAEDSVTSQSSSRGRKRGADVSMLTTETPQPTPKTPRRSVAGQTHKVLFTGVADEDGEKVVVRLGGGLAKGVGDMTHLVTDKVRRTVKFLCAVARGVPIVTPDWLSKCGKAGSFLSPNGFLVKDEEQEKRFNFSLQEALRVASAQPLLQGYEIHVTPSVKPEPAQMKEIITCCGARFLPKMPSAHKAQKVVVVSCEEDRALCERAQSLSFPVVSAEFLLTGILQQKVDVQTHSLSLSPAAAVPKPAARSRRK